jgi:hypothetical protein
MPRGAPAIALESLVPYFRGARYSLVGLRLHHPDLPQQVQADIERRIAMLDRFTAAATATYRLRRERERKPPA